MTDDSFEKYIRHTISMSQLTNVELVNIYWGHAHEIAEKSRLAFVIRGNVEWESEQPEGVSSNDFWLKSNRYEPVGKHLFEEPVRTYLQWYMNIFEIWGTIAIDIDPNDALSSKSLIDQALKKVTCVSNTMSFLYGASLRWFPAVYRYIRHEPMGPPPEHAVTESWDCLPLSRSQDESTSILLTDEHITDELFLLVDKIETLPQNVQTVIGTAIDWHAQANHHASGLNRFVNYWESIELLGNFFYKMLPPDVVQYKTEGDKKKAIIKLLNEKKITPRNCMKIIKDCNEIRRPTAQTKILAFLSIITDRDQMEAALFEPDDKTEKSLYKIRNDIVHGELSEHHFDTIELFSHQLFDVQNISQEIILLTIKNAEKLNAYAEVNYDI